MTLFTLSLSASLLAGSKSWVAIGLLSERSASALTTQPEQAEMKDIVQIL